MGFPLRLGTLELRVTGRRFVMRVALLAALTIVGIAVIAGQAAPKPKPEEKPQVRTVTTTETVTVTPPACEQLVTDTDAFIAVTGDYLTAGNNALDALLAFDDKALHQQVQKMHRLEDRYGAVMDRYQDSRAGCL